MSKTCWQQVAALVAVIGALTLPMPARGAIDLTGTWYLRLDSFAGSQVLPIGIVQTGTLLTLTQPPGGSTIFAGTIDVDTGAFSLSGELCSGQVDTLTGTAAADSNGFTASGNLHYPNVFCISLATTATGVRGLCGDGAMADFGEDCDDGNTISGDCCSSSCAYEPSGTLCSDGNVSTCDACDGAGICQGSMCPTFDLSGPWVFPFEFEGLTQTMCLQIVQNGVSVSATYCAGGTTSFLGTVDPVSRHFTITQPPEPCVPGLSGSYCDVDATAAADFSSWTGTFTCRVMHTTPPPGCFVAPDEVTALPAACGDGYVLPPEQCDDGGGLPTDCCTPTCQYAPESTPCTYGTFPCATCNDSGVCAPQPCNSTLDHYKCYGGKDLKTPQFVEQSVQTSDQLASEQVGVDKLKYLCTPVDKNGEGINDPSAHLACYQINGASLAPRPTSEVSTQFQTSRFELKRPRLMCVAATKTLLP